MKGSVASVIEGRLELYRQVFAFCRRGGFSFARFLALVPERLRLAGGSDPHRIRVPLHVAEEIPALWRATRPPGTAEPAGALHRSVPELKRLVRLAQSDPQVDVVHLAAWLDADAEVFVDGARRVYARAFAEVGRGGGGLETAYLVHHAALSSIAGVTSAGPAPWATAALLHPLLDRAIEAAADPRGEALPARLGYQLAVTTSPLALGAPIERLGERPLNVYRATPEAIGLARRVVHDPVELIDLDRVVDILTERQLVDAALHAGLRRAVLLELARDGLLLLVAQSWTPRTAGAVGLLREIVASPSALEQHVFVRRRRELLAQQLRGRVGAHPAAAAVLRLVDGTEQILAGDLTPLGLHGDLRERARSAARGALAVVLDERTEGLRRDLAALVEPVDVTAWEAGLAYRVGLDDQPLYRADARAAEGYLLIEASALAEQLAMLPTVVAAEVIARELHQPILAACRRAAGDDAARVRVVRWTSDQIALAGDLPVIVELALEVRMLVVSAARRARGAVPDVRGGIGERAAEVSAELERLGERLVSVESALLRFSEDPASTRFLRDSHAVLVRERQALDRSRGDLRPLVIGAFIALAEPAHQLTLPGVDGTPLRLVLSRGHAEAAIATRRVAEVEPGSEGRSSLFDVVLAPRLSVPAALTAELEVALAHRDSRSLAALVERWSMSGVTTRSDEVHNAGCAISEEALEALMHDRRAVWRFEDRTVAAADLPPALRAQLAEDATIGLRAALRASDGELVHLFRAVGALRTPELTRPLVLWEMLPLEGDFVRALRGAS